MILQVIYCVVCMRTHYAPDCDKRENLKGPGGKFPMPINGCSVCWYGFHENPHKTDSPYCDRYIGELEGQR